jgi:putative heme degradation protein
MLLKMDRLGPVRIDLAMFGDSLEVGFCVQSETARRILASAADQVKDALGKVYDRVQIVTRSSELKIAQFEQEDLAGRGSGMIDIQI